MLWYVEDEDEDGDDDDDDDDDEDEALTSLTRSMTELAAGSRDAFARVGIVEIDDISAMQFYPTVGSANAWLILIEHFQKIQAELLIALLWTKFGIFWNAWIYCSMSFW